jgi:hypothetical protein
MCPAHENVVKDVPAVCAEVARVGFIFFLSVARYSRM